MNAGDHDMALAAEPYGLFVRPHDWDALSLSQRRRHCRQWRRERAQELAQHAAFRAAFPQFRLTDPREISDLLDSIGPPALAPAWRRRFDGDELLPAHHQFNPSLLAYRGGRAWMAYRTDWGQARIVLAELDSAWRIVRQRTLAVPAGSEDPRLFVFRGQLHVAYASCQNTGRALRTGMRYAQLGDDGEVLAILEPQYAAAQALEKNWSFFEAGNDLHAVYWLSGRRRILRIDGARALLAHDYRQDLPYAGGEPRGGASPILHDGQFYAFFHGVIGEGSDRVYSAGLYTFDAQPPFRIRRFIRQPLLLPDLAERPQIPRVSTCVYPAGAMLHAGQWIVSLGNYDHYCELAAFDAAEIERLLA